MRISTPAVEGVLRVSKSLKYPVLIDIEEMRSLFMHLGDFCIYVVSEVVNRETAAVSQEEFLERYAGYVDALKSGTLPDERPLKRYFSSIFSLSPEPLYAQQVGEERFLVKSLKPIIQLQSHHFFFSQVDHKFHSMVSSEGSVTWGIQFSYPQIYQDPKSLEFSKVSVSSDFPNTALFLRLVQWLRKNTQPTPFIHGGKRENVPIRIGKQCLSWINVHPQLVEQGLLCMQK